MISILYATLTAVLTAASTGVLGFYLGHRHICESVEKKLVSRLAEIKTEFERVSELAEAVPVSKLDKIMAELEAIENTADRRIAPAIHAVTARIRAHV